MMSEYSGCDDFTALREAYSNEHFESGCGGNRGTDGGVASGTATGSLGSTGVAWGSVGNVAFNNSGPVVGAGGGGSCIQGTGGFGNHGGIWIKSYK